MGLKPEIAAYLAERAATGLPQVWQAPLAEIRENTKLHVALKQPLLQRESLKITTITITCLITQKVLVMFTAIKKSATRIYILR